MINFDAATACGCLLSITSGTTFVSKRPLGHAVVAERPEQRRDFRSQFVPIATVPMIEECKAVGDER
jgi:hypothetical protein